LREAFAASGERPPLKGRGRKLLSLFTFEFVVVVLGVFAAQVLQDWFGDRAEARRGAEAVAVLDREAERFVSTAEYRLRAHDCETKRLDRIAALVRSGASGTPEELATPLMPMPVITQWSDETRLAVARHADTSVLQRYDGLTLLARMISERQRALEDRWADFRLLEPQWAGLARPQGELALAVARARGLLGAIDMNAAYVASLAPKARPQQRGLAALAAMDHPCAAVAMVPAPKQKAP
jgi:hypothetical protein